MEDWKAGFRAELRAIAIATGEAASAQIPGLLRRLHRHQAGLGGNPILGLYHRWRIRSLARAVADAPTRPTWNKGDYFGTTYNGPMAK